MSPISTRKKVEHFAIYSRLLVLFIQVLFNFVIPDHDAKAFNPPSVHRTQSLDYYVDLMFTGFKRWDGVYFHHIAEHGYTYENTLAFFPMFPLLVRILANTIFYPLQLLVNYGIVLTISGYILNFFVFIKSAVVIYDLSLRVLKDETLAFKAAQLYSINPASIFFSALYSETLFAFLAFKGMLYIERKRLMRCSMLFGLSCVTRSNGLVNIGFILHHKLIDAIDTMKSVYNTQFIYQGTRILAVLSYMLLVSLHLLLQSVCCALPFIVYQYYSYTLFCDKNASYRDLPAHILNYGNTQGYKMAHTGLSAWCHYNYPMSYKYVQENHWNNGFMKYWEYKQIPNFLLALPIVAISICAVFNYVRKNMLYSITLGMHKPREMEHYKKFDEAPKFLGFHQHSVYVYVIHLLFLVLFGIFFMHVQVLTRFVCSSSPVVYWFIAHLTTPIHRLSPVHDERLASGDTSHSTPPCATIEASSQDGELNTEATQHKSSKQQNGAANTNVCNNTSYVPIGDKSEDSEALGFQDLDDLYDWDSSSWLQRLIFVYIHLYFFVGTAAFVNFFPWT